MPSTRSIILLILACALATPTGRTQVSAPEEPHSPGKPVHIHSVMVRAAGEETVMQIDANGPVIPTIGKLDNPRQIIIDLPNAAISGHPKAIDFHSREIAAIRLAQLPTQPPLTRIVVELSQAMAYDWDRAHNRLMIRLRAQPNAATPPAIVASPAMAVKASGVKAVLWNGSPLGAGSSVNAGPEAAELRLGRGGKITVCPHTSLSVTPSKDGGELLLGMSTGALETHYSLPASADSILTPDFRVLLAGPGDFHFAVSADAHGDTCVRSLPGNTASAIVTELVGDGSYQVKPTEEVVFHSGQLKLIDSRIPDDCGCPAPEPVPAAQIPGSEMGKANGGAVAKIVPTTPATAPVPESKPGDVHVQVDAPLIFHGKAPSPIQESPAREAQNLPVTNAPQASPISETALPPPAAGTSAPAENGNPQHHSVFGKIKGFFGRLFR